MSHAPRILIVDDEPAIRRLLSAALDRAGYRLVEAATAKAALTAAQIDKPDAILLDLGLPDRDGLELVPLLKKTGAAVIVVSAREATDEKVSALDLGADDYVTKPFDTDEVLARIRTALRHRLAADAPVVRALGVEIDLSSRIVRKDGEEVHLTAKEYGLLAELARHPGRIVTHRQLLTQVWGGAFEQNIEYTRIVVRNLRRKLEQEPATPRLIVNELGIGYRLRSAED